MLKGIFTIALLLCLSGMSSFQQNQGFLVPDEQSWLEQNSGSIEILFGYQAPPNAFHNEQGEYVGLLVDFQREIEQQLGIAFRLRSFDTWKALMEYSATGNNFVVVGIAETDARSEYLNFTAPFIKVPYVVVTRRNDTAQTMQQLASKKVCTVQNYAINDYLADQYPQLTPIPVMDNLKGLQAVSSGDCDAMVVNQMYASWLIEEQGITNLRIAFDSGYINRLSAATSRQDIRLFNILEKAVDQIDNQRRRALYQRWITGQQMLSDIQRFMLIILFALTLLALTILLLRAWQMRKRLHQQSRRIRLAREQFETVIMKAPLPMLITDYQNNILLLNENFFDVFGYRNIELNNLDQLFNVLCPNPAYRDQLLSQWHKFTAEEQGDNYILPEWELKTQTAFKLSFEIRITLLKDIILVAMSDITHRKEQEQNMLHQAHYDSLTDLPNRFLVIDRLNRMISDAQRNNTQLAVMFADLDYFKHVNDNMGHDAGDILLVQAGERLTHSLRETDTVGRLGGDEFIILIGALKHTQDLEEVAENLRQHFLSPFHIKDQRINCTISIGIAMFPDHGSSASDLIQRADEAMYKAKQQGRNQTVIYDPDKNR